MAEGAEAMIGDESTIRPKDCACVTILGDPVMALQGSFTVTSYPNYRIEYCEDCQREIAQGSRREVSR